MNTFKLTAYHLSKFIPCVSTAAHPQQKRVKYQAANLHELQAIKNKFIPCMIPRRHTRKKNNRSTKLITCYLQRLVALVNRIKVGKLAAAKM